MAVEILIFNRLTYFDGMSFEELQDKRQDPKFDKMYDARFQIGDPVRIYEGPHFKTASNPGGKNFNKLKFSVLILPNMNYDEAIKLYESQYKEAGTEEILKERKYKIDMSKFSFTERISIEEDNLKFEIEDKTVESKAVS